jgi:hypothetical protein
MFKLPKSIVLGSVVLFSGKPTLAAQPSNPSAETPDPQIAAALQQVSAQQIQANIEKLVGFYTHSTLSVRMTTFRNQATA